MAVHRVKSVMWLVGLEDGSTTIVDPLVHFSDQYVKKMSGYAQEALNRGGAEPTIDGPIYVAVSK